MLIVMKFGGTSVGSAQRIAQAAPKIRAGVRKIGERTIGKPLKNQEKGTARIAAPSRNR